MVQGTGNIPPYCVISLAARAFPRSRRPVRGTFAGASVARYHFEITHAPLPVGIHLPPLAAADHPYPLQYQEQRGEGDHAHNCDSALGVAQAGCL